MSNANKGPVTELWVVEAAKSMQEWIDSLADTISPAENISHGGWFMSGWRHGVDHERLRSQPASSVQGVDWGKGPSKWVGSDWVVHAEQAHASRVEEARRAIQYMTRFFDMSDEDMTHYAEAYVKSQEATSAP